MQPQRCRTKTTINQLEWFVVGRVGIEMNLTLKVTWNSRGRVSTLCNAFNQSRSFDWMVAWSMEWWWLIEHNSRRSHSYYYGRSVRLSMVFRFDPHRAKAMDWCAHVTFITYVLVSRHNELAAMRGSGEHLLDHILDAQAVHVNLTTTATWMHQSDCCAVTYHGSDMDSGSRANKCKTPQDSVLSVSTIEENDIEQINSIDWHTGFTLTLMANHPFWRWLWCNWKRGKQIIGLAKCIVATSIVIREARG